MTEKKETIYLDAVLRTMLSDTAFGAELSNGHEFVAFLGREDIGNISLQVGQKVFVGFSPFDMSKARVLNRE